MNFDASALNMDNYLGWFSLDENINGALYHYTSLSSLQGIIENKEFWITHSSFMNDSGESIYFWSIVREVLDEILKNEHRQARIFSDFVNYMIKTIHYIELNPSYSNNYILSFSGSSDSLSMWNYYGKNDGYCMALNPMGFLSDWINDASLGSKLFFKVVYDQNIQKQMLSSEFIKIVDLYISNITTWSQGDIPVLCNKLLGRWLIYSAFFKHPSFRNEEEYRVAFLSYPGEIYYRAYQGIMAPYAKVKIAKDDQNFPLDSITIGPMIRHDQAEKGLDGWLRKQGINGYSLFKSSVPIRF